MPDRPATGSGDTVALVSGAPVVVCVGCLTLDVQHVVERVPERNEKTVGLGQRVTFGGPAANAAATAAALGAGAHLVAPFGRCPVTAFVAAALSAAGVRWVDPSGALDNPSPVSSLLVDRASGERAVVSGGVMSVPAGATVPAGLVADADAVLLDGHAMTLARQAARQARARGIPVVLDGGSHKPGLADLLPEVDLAILSGDFVAPGGGDPLAWAHRCGARHVARSDGPHEVAVLAEGRRFAVPVPAVPAKRVVDTVGAGDVLHGAAVVAAATLGVGTAAQARAVLEFAVEVATRSVQAPGALGWADLGG